MNIRILSDSTCDLSEDIIKEYGIEILPIVVIKDDKEYLDKVDIDPKEVYEGMRSGIVFKTSQVPTMTFIEKFEQCAKDKSSAIYISVSSELSGTHQTSLSIRNDLKDKYSDLDLDIVDSRSASEGYGLIVLGAAKLAKEGKTKEEILKAIEFYKQNMEGIFTVDNIEFLFRSGRVSKTQAFVGGLLNIKPVLNIDSGKLIPIEKVRGRNKAFKSIVDIMESRGKNADLKNQMIGITHGDDLEGAMKIRDLIIERFGVDKFLINIIGASVGAHVGPGTIAVFFLKENIH